MDNKENATNNFTNKIKSFVDWVNADTDLPSLKELEQAHSHTHHEHVEHDPETDSAGMQPMEHSEDIQLLHEELPVHSSDTADLSESDAEEPTAEYLAFEQSATTDEELQYPDPITPVEEKKEPRDWQEEISSAVIQFNQRMGIFKKFYSVIAVSLTLVIIGALLVTVSQLPAFGETGNPAQNIVYDKYVNEGVEDTGAINLVAGIILDYRAFDTLGESVMLFTATMGVVFLLREVKATRKTGKEDD